MVRFVCAPFRSVLILYLLILCRHCTKTIYVIKNHRRPNRYTILKLCCYFHFFFLYWTVTLFFSSSFFLFVLRIFSLENEEEMQKRMFDSETEKKLGLFLLFGNKSEKIYLSWVFKRLMYAKNWCQRPLHTLSWTIIQLCNGFTKT